MAAAEMTMTPAADFPAGEDTVRVWYSRQPENVIDCFDFPFVPGTTFRDLRDQVALRANELLLTLGFVGLDSQLYALDSEVNPNQRIILVCGPLKLDQALGPFLDHWSVTLLTTAEVLDLVVCYAALVAVSVPIEHMQWRKIEVLRQEGVVLPLMQLIRRVYRTEGLNGFYRGAVLMVANVATSGVLSQLLRANLPLYLGSIPSYVCDGFEQLMSLWNLLVTHTVAVTVVRSSATSAALPRQRWGLLPVFMWCPSLAELRRSFRTQLPGLAVTAVTVVATGYFEGQVSDTGSLTVWLKRRGLDLRGLLGHVPLVIVSALFCHPFYNVDRWVAVNLPQKSAWQSVCDIYQRGHIYSFLLDSIFMEVWVHFTLTGASTLYNSVIRRRLMSLGRRKGLHDRQIARIMLREALVRTGLLCAGLGAIFYFKGA